MKTWNLLIHCYPLERSCISLCFMMDQHSSPKISSSVSGSGKGRCHCGRKGKGRQSMSQILLLRRQASWNYWILSFRRTQHSCKEHISPALMLIRYILEKTMKGGGKLTGWLHRTVFLNFQMEWPLMFTGFQVQMHHLDIWVHFSQCCWWIHLWSVFSTWCLCKRCTEC